MQVEIIDRQRHAVDRALLREIAKRTCELARGAIGELSVVLLDDGQMAELNKRLTGDDWPTDVLAFEAERDPDTVRAEIYVNTDAAQRQGLEYGHGFVYELCFLLAHGVLHALGMTDQGESDRREMFRLQEKAVQSVGVGRDD